MNKIARIAITVVVVAICFLFLMPTIRWTLFTSDEDRALVSLSNYQVKERAQKSDDSQAFREKVASLKKISSRSLQLGLDLKGGMSIILEADTDAFREKLGHDPSDAEINEAAEQNVEILKKRIDQYGLAEPEVRRNGSTQILIELAGTQDPERVESFIRGKGSLAFHLVDQNLTSRVRMYYAEHQDELFNADGSMRDVRTLSCPVMKSAKGKTLVGSYHTDEYGIETADGMYVISSEPALDGNCLLSAEAQKDNMNQTVVAIHFSDDGGEKFWEFTSKNVGSVLAIVMDGKLRSAATIKEPLRSNVQISGFSVQEANDLAVMLKTSSLPMEMKVESMQRVGAGLGEDAVKTGLRAVAIGFLLVVIFMAVFYQGCGLVADAALVLNMLMIVSAMGGFGSTLTLTGIAGIILTLGMAVDANVIIYERIREELESGKNALKAVENGFSRALWTILDSNITTMIAAVVLIIFGSSSVKGFATTLAIGIVSSLFTSLFVSHLILDLTVTNKISIGRRWRSSK